MDTKERNLTVIKRDGKEVAWDDQRIVNAIEKASDSVQDDYVPVEEAEQIAAEVFEIEANSGHAATVEDISDRVEKALWAHGHYSVGHEYITYRYKRQLARKANTTDGVVLSIVDRANEDVKQENSNKNPVINSTQRDYVAGEVSRDITNRLLLPSDVVEAHKEGIIHFHDSDYYIQRMDNCCLVNLEDMLQNGTVISGVMIEKPHSFATACNIATQAIAQIASNQYGGQSITLSHLAPFVDISRQKHRADVKKELEDAGLSYTEEAVNKMAEERVRKEVKAGMQTVQYQVITLMTTNGQAPFITVFMYLDEVPEGQERDDLAMMIEEMLHQRIQGVKNEKGVWITPAFPKLIYVLDEDNIREGSRYFYLTKLAAECTSKRMVPDYISAKIMREQKGDVYPCMGCRSFLTPDRFTDAGKGNMANAGNYKPGEHKYYGRFNQGVVTINLVDVACSSHKDKAKFWEILDERLELCHKALKCRHERLMGTPSDVAPILWQYGAYARLKKGETIDKLLFDGYSTISLGYAGLYEMTYYMKNCSHTDPKGKPFAMAVMQRLNDKCAEWKKAENIDYSVYGTPLESTTYKFAKCLQKRFGIIENVTDHNYITNSYHVNVREKINAFDKLAFESEFQKLSPGGAISYVEVPNMTNNLDAVISIMQFMYENIMYSEMNTKLDYCQECGYNGEIKIVKADNGKLIWECPNCGNRDQNKMNVARRTCGQD